MSELVHRTRHSRDGWDVALLAAPFGFGPLGKALAIAEHLREKGHRTLVMTDSIGTRVARAAGAAVAAYAYRQPLDLVEVQAKVVVSCLDVSTPLTKRGVPVILLDSLLWLRGTWERSPSYNEDVYAAQRFFVAPSPETLSLIGSELCYVDAVLRRSFQEFVPVSTAENVVIYPGGMRSPYLTSAYQQTYLGWILDNTVAAMQRAQRPIDSAFAVLPPQLLRCAAAARFRACGGRTVSAIDDLAELVGSARHLIAAAGIEFVLEALACGRTPLLLPAFNASHLPQLAAFEGAGVGIELSPSHRFEMLRLLGPARSLSDTSQRVAELNRRLIEGRCHSDEFIERLATSLAAPVEAPTDRFPLGRHGAHQVADVVERLM